MGSKKRLFDFSKCIYLERDTSAWIWIKTSFKNEKYITNFRYWTAVRAYETVICEAGNNESHIEGSQDPKLTNEQTVKQIYQLIELRMEQGPLKWWCRVRYWTAPMAEPGE